MSRLRIETAYLPPLAYFRWWRRVDEVVIEAHENYQKGGYRNRALILGANGPLRLTVPLQRGKHERLPIREVRIDYKLPWQAQHWQSIRSAYGRAPYFEHYADRLQPHFIRRPTFLFDLNLGLIDSLLPLVRDLAPYRLSEAYALDTDETDGRGALRPNRPLPDFLEPLPYPQVFTDRFGFTPRLSVLDALFCGAGVN